MESHVPLKWTIFQACRAKLRLASWRKYTSDPWLLKNIHGYKVEFVRLPSQIQPAHEIRLSSKEELIMAQDSNFAPKRGDYEIYA